MSDLKKRNEMLTEARNLPAIEAERNISKYRQVVQSRSARLTADSKPCEVHDEGHSSGETKSDDELRTKVTRQFSVLLNRK